MSIRHAIGQLIVDEVVGKFREISRNSPSASSAHSMILISGCVASAVASLSAELSVLPSSTKMISKGRLVRRSTDVRAFTSGAMLSSSLKTGTTPDNSHLRSSTTRNSQALHSLSGRSGRGSSTDGPISDADAKQIEVDRRDHLVNYSAWFAVHPATMARA